MHIAVIGAGPGGYAAAFLAADLGMKVTLIDPEANPGGVCLYRGCIPSKALLHIAKLIEESKHAKNWGVEFAEPKVDIARLRSFKESVVRDPRGTLAHRFDLPLPESVEVRVHDSTSDVRWMVLPRRPAGTEGWSEEELARLVTIDALVGAAEALSPASIARTER